MKAVVAMDSFKGSLTSLEAGEAVREGILRAMPDARVTVRPLADGGEGTVEALTAGMGGRRERVTVTGPIGRPVEAVYGILDGGRTAVMEMSAAAGLTLVPAGKRDPLRATTYGVGEMIRDAIGKGCRRLIVGIGGSATNDGGAGMLQALGFSLLDRAGRQVEPGARGLAELAEIFDIAGISKSPAIFDIEKLTHFNALYLRAMTPEAFHAAAEPYIHEAVKNPALDTAAIAALLQARCERLTDIPKKVAFFETLPHYEKDLFTNKKSKTNEEVSKRMLEAAVSALEEVSDWTQEGIHVCLTDLAAKLEVKNATLMWPVRIAAAGQAVTPGGAIEICLILGREECLRRLRIGLEMLGA